jgi:hypothetical protein
MSEHREDAHENEDVLPETDPGLEDVIGDRPRLHVPFRDQTGFEDRSEALGDDLEDQKRQLWQARVRAGVQTVGRIVKELGSFLASFDEWKRSSALGSRLINTDTGEARPILTKDTVLPLAVKTIRDSYGKLIEFEHSTGPTTIPPGGSFDMMCRPQVLFRPRRVVFLSTEADNFLVHDAKIGKNSQWAASGPVAARIFSEISFGMSMKWETAQISMDVILRCQNISKETQPPPQVCIIGEYAY